MRFVVNDSTGIFAGANENPAPFATNADGTFAYTFTETYAAPPVVIPTGISPGTAPANALQPKMTTITATGCTGVIYGVQPQTLPLNLAGGLVTVNTMVALTSPVQVQLMVLGKGT
jgi:hypothetical protein